MWGRRKKEKKEEEKLIEEAQDLVEEAEELVEELEEEAEELEKDIEELIDGVSDSEEIEEKLEEAEEELEEIEEKLEEAEEKLEGVREEFEEEVEEELEEIREDLEEAEEELEEIREDLEEEADAHQEVEMTTEEPEEAEPEEVEEPVKEGVSDIDALLVKSAEKHVGSLDENGVPLSTKREGFIAIKNLGEKDSIFDIDIKLNNIDQLVGLNENISIAELNPQEKHIVEYEDKQIEVLDLPFVFEKIVNTNPEEGKFSNVVSYGQEMQVKVNFKFVFQQSLKHVILKQQLPEVFGETTVEETSEGETSLEDGALTWTLNDVEIGDSVECVLILTLDVNMTEPVSTGKTTIEYKAVDTYQTKMKVESTFGYVGSRTYVESDEKEEEINKWTNQLCVENTSEFPIVLNKVNVSSDSDHILDLSFDDDDLVIQSGNQWKSDVWEAESKELPLFNKSIEYSVFSKKKSVIKGELSVEESMINIAYAKGEKSYTPKEITPYKSNPIEIQISVLNLGNVDFAKLEVIDELIPLVQTPDVNNMSVWISSLKDSSEQHLNSSEYFVSVEPSYAGLGDTRKFICSILRKVEPDQVVNIRYNTDIVDPSTEASLECKPKAVAKIESTPDLEIELEDESHLFEIKRIVRKLTWSKDVHKTAEMGTYNITLYFKNRSNGDLENIVLQDLIPKGFELVKDDPTVPSEFVSENEEGKIRKWVIEQLETEQEIEIQYTVKGDVEYNGRKLLVSY